MAPKCWRWFKSKLKREKRQDVAATLYVSSQHIAETPAPPAVADSTASGLQARIWNEAYDNLKREEPKLVDAYERLLSRELSKGDLSSMEMDEAPLDNEIEQTDSKKRRSQMLSVVQAGLDKTKKEAAVKHAIQGKMHVVSSVKELISEAVKLAPEAAIAWAGACFALQMLANPIKETGANRDGIVYVISRMEWYWNLSSLLLEENQVDKAAALRGELEKHVIDLYKMLLSYQMKSVCSYYRDRFVVFLGDMVKLDDWEETLQSIKDAESAIGQDSASYSTEEIKSRLGELVRAAESLAADILLGMREALQDMRQEDKNEKCLVDLRGTDPRHDKERIKQTKGGLLADSSNWIFAHKDFQRWYDDDDAKVLWIKGDPGKGKTMLLITIVDELERRLKQLNQPHQQSTAALSYFFCQGTISDLNNATSVLRGLVYLLGVQNPSLLQHLRNDYDTAGPKLFDGVNAFFSLSKVLEGMLQEASLSRAYIAIDALDECEVELPRLLQFIAKNSSVSSRVKWIVSSRNKPAIETQLKLDDSRMKLSLELTQNAEQVSRAVNAYIDFKISTIQSLQDDNEEREKVRRIMYRKANGTFLWVALVIKELEDPETLDEASTVVEEIPTDLYELYDRMMSQIQQSKYLKYCRRVLSTVTITYRPLHLAELSVLSELPQSISSSEEKVRRIVAMCGSLLTIQNDYVYHIHQSAKDYLNDRANNVVFPSGITDAHRIIFSKSLQAMSILRRDIGRPVLLRPLDRPFLRCIQ
ncbi:hypothetical protein ONZ43_g6953 [Nemania bipapillata]|uniref:Uncharacterized protein n=1 Tax=Nemania bipapillata TaxID=110536 RepID=A0ACC2HUJ9_9PEZI|nr:hypothetical protein ONZ43_g6953 [Nemania bipapillata]